MNGGRGAKGSINDRLIGMMYRNRYSRLQLQKDAYTKPNKEKEKEFLKTIQGFSIDNAQDIKPYLDAHELSELEQVLSSDSEVPELSLNPKVGEQLASIQGIKRVEATNVEALHEMSDKFIDVDIATEVFDFERYDYYEIIQKYTGVALLSGDIDIEKEIDKVDDEIVIIEELTTFIDESKQLLSELKGDIAMVQAVIPEQITQEQITELEATYVRIRLKVEDLKRKYDVVKEKYNFEDFEILASIQMMSAIEDYKNKASLDELETLVEVCKTEIDEISGILVEDQKSVGVGQNITEKKQSIQTRDAGFAQTKKGVIYLDDLEQRIAVEAIEQQEIIKQLERKLGEFSTGMQKVTTVAFHTELLFGSFLKIAAGILTAPFSGRKIFGTMLGIHLINKGINGLSRSLHPDTETKWETVNRYRSIEHEILNSKDHVQTTNRLIMDSIDQLDRFDEEFKDKFKEYAGAIPEYNQVEKQIAELKKKLNRKKIEIAIMSKDLDRQYEDNKVKVKKAS